MILEIIVNSNINNMAKHIIVRTMALLHKGCRQQVRRGRVHPKTNWIALRCPPARWAHDEDH